MTSSRCTGAVLFLVAVAGCSDGGRQRADATQSADTRPDSGAPDSDDAPQDVPGPDDVDADAADDATAMDIADAPDGIAPDQSTDRVSTFDLGASDVPLLDPGACAVDRTFSAAESAAFFPFQAGGRWIFKATTGTVAPTTFLSSREVIATRPIGGATTLVVQHTNSDGNRVDIEEYLEVNPTGLVNHGNTAGPGAYPINPAFFAAPFVEIKFPVSTCSTSEPVNAMGLDSGRDSDGDGVNETLNIRSATLLRLETVTVPLGTFTDALRVETAYEVTTVYSKSRFPSRERRKAIDWYATGVGPVKRTLSATSRDLTFELIAYTVGGTSHGLLPQGLLARDLPQERTVGAASLRAGVGSDGKQFLVAMPLTFPPSFNGRGGLQGFIVGVDGKVRRSTPLLDNTSDVANPIIVFDGTRYLIGYNNSGRQRVEVIVVSTDGDTTGGPIALSNTANPAPVGSQDDSSGGVGLVATRSGFLISYGQGVYRNGLSSPVQRYAQVDSTGHPGERVTPFPDLPIGGGLLASDGTAALSMWRGTSTLTAARIGADGRAIDAAPFTVVNVPDAMFSDVTLTFTGTHYLAVWTQSLRGKETIRTARIATDGTLLDGPPSAGGISVGTDANYKRYPRAARFGTSTLILWEQQLMGGIFGTRFTDDGKTLDVTPSQDGLLVLGAIGTDRSAFPRQETATMGWGGDRGLVVWTQNVGDSSKIVNLGAALAFPW